MLYSLVLYAIALILLAHRLYDLKNKGARSTATFLALLLISTLLFAYESANIPILLSGVILLNAIITYYGTELCYLYIAIGAVYSVLVYPILGTQFIAQTFLLGLLSGSNFSKERKKKTNKNIEMRRNVVQILAGMILIGTFYLLGTSMATVILLAMILLGLFSATYADRNRLSVLGREIYRIERKDIGLGVGAIWLAIGSLVAVSFLSNNLILVVFAALFIGDSFSTMIGINYGRKRRLPYNKNKSIPGTLAYFISTSIVSYTFIGIAGILISLIAAFIESQPFHIDDNFDVSLVLTILLLI